MTAIKHTGYLLLVLALWTTAMTMDAEAERTTERLTLEQVEAIALDRTRTLVACAQSRNIIVGDKLIECKSFDISVREMNW